MQINLTITITVPDDGTTPVINVNNDAVATPAQTPVPRNSAVAEDVYDELNRLAKEAHGKPRQKKEPKEKTQASATFSEPEKQSKPKRKNPDPNKHFFPERSCEYCGEPFYPRVYNQMFNTPECKVLYYKEKRAKAKAEKLKNRVPKPKKVKPKKSPSIDIPMVATPTSDDVTNDDKLKKITVPAMHVSKDPYYQEQLKEAARKNKRLYDKYI